MLCIRDRSHRRNIHRKHTHTTDGFRLLFWGEYRRWKVHGRFQKFFCKSTGSCRHCRPLQFCARGNGRKGHRTEDQRQRCRGHSPESHGRREQSCVCHRRYALRRQTPSCARPCGKCRCPGRWWKPSFPPFPAPCRVSARPPQTASSRGFPDPC